MMPKERRKVLGSTDSQGEATSQEVNMTLNFSSFSSMDKGSKVCIQGSDLASWVQESQLYKELRISAKESWAEQTR